MYFFFLSFVFILIMIFFFKNSHLLNMLLNLEMIIIYCMILMSMTLMNNKDMYVILLFLVLSTCESVVGLALFVIFIRYYSKDYMKYLFVMKF